MSAFVKKLCMGGGGFRYYSMFLYGSGSMSINDRDQDRVECRYDGEQVSDDDDDNAV